ncbi:MAG: hypothetical protein QXM93_09555, partial [Candidatus Methanomethyliaceae archaeon]
RYSFEYAKIFIGNGDPLPTIVVSVVFMLIMTWIIYKIDWIEATQYIEKNGVVAYIKFMMSKRSR